MYRRIFSVLMFLCFVGFSFETHAQETEQYKKCASSWLELKGQANGDPKKLLNLWVDLSSQCTGSGIYEYRLATVEAANGDIDGALVVLSKSIAMKLPLNDDDQILYAGYKFDSAVLKQPQNPSDITSAVAALEQLAITHPRSQSVLISVSLAHLYQQRFPEAAQESAQLIAINSSLWQAHRNLAIALIYTNKMKAAEPEVNLVLASHPEARYDRDFALALAHFYARTDRRSRAQSVLRELTEKSPNLKADRGVTDEIKQDAL